MSDFSISARSELSQLTTETFLNDGVSSASSKYFLQCTPPLLPEKNHRSKYDRQYVTPVSTITGKKPVNFYSVYLCHLRKVAILN